MKLIKLIFLSLIIFTPINAIESYIKFKVNNEIITNIDLDIEYRYLIALNNELKNVDKDVLLKLAKESIIREKIKKNELLKYYEFDSSEEYLNNMVKNFYKKININNLDDFKIYLSNYNLELENVRDKIQLQVLWNRLVGMKYVNQLNINEKILKQQIEKTSNTDGFIAEYDLSEIIFQIDDQNNLSDKINLIQKDIKEQGFKNTANIHSISDSSKFGGEIGWVDEKQLSQKISLAIRKLEINEISKPIKVANGYLILKINNKKQKIIEIDKKKLLEEAIIFESNKQYSKFSIIYYNKIKLNSIISE
jgi:peptidyl-prolyl cis-trans isomerase SurA